MGIKRRLKVLLESATETEDERIGRALILSGATLRAKMAELLFEIENYIEAHKFSERGRTVYGLPFCKELINKFYFRFGTLATKEFLRAMKSLRLMIDDNEAKNHFEEQHLTYCDKVFEIIHQTSYPKGEIPDELLEFENNKRSQISIYFRAEYYQFRVESKASEWDTTQKIALGALISHIPTAFRFFRDLLHLHH